MEGLYEKMNKIAASVVMVICLLVSSVSVFAQEKQELDEVFKNEEWRRMERVINSEDSSQWIGIVEENVPLNNNMSTYPHCVDCAALAVTVCAAEAILVDEGYHNNFVGVPTDCYAYYFESHGAAMCPQCHKVIEQYGQHACWERHKKCSKGDYDVCPMQVS